MASVESSRREDDARLRRVQEAQATNLRLLRRVVRQHGGRMFAYRELPRPAKLAMAHYMAVDGEAWEQPEAWDRNVLEARTRGFKIRLAQSLPYFVQRYGAQRFGLVYFPRDVAMRTCWEMKLNADAAMSSAIPEYASFMDYHAWYASFPIDRHDSREPWPSILDSVGDEFLQDGWHRFHRYVQLRMTRLPFLYYPGLMRGAKPCSPS